jgi:hypothetical protein
MKFEEKQRNIPNIDIKYLEQNLYISIQKHGTLVKSSKVFRNGLKLGLQPRSPIGSPSPWW